MKFKIFFFISLVTLFSCNSNNDDENPEIVGKWKLIETLSDPGDGSGTFQPINSSKVIEFHTDNSVTSNSSLCNMSSVTNATTTGKYNEQEFTLFSLSCNPQMTLNYSIENNRLIINHLCIEACAEKYIKIN